MSKWIDEDALKKSIDDCDICNICPDKDVRCDYDCDFPDCLTPKWETLIDSAPSIDIVRCKECKHAHMTYGGDCKYCDMWKDDDDFCIELYLDGDFYCAYGEREGE